MELLSTSVFKVTKTSPLVTEESLELLLEPSTWLMHFEETEPAGLLEVVQANQVDSKLDEVCVLERRLEVPVSPSPSICPLNAIQLLAKMFKLKTWSGHRLISGTPCRDLTQASICHQVYARALVLLRK